MKYLLLFLLFMPFSGLAQKANIIPFIVVAGGHHNHNKTIKPNYHNGYFVNKKGDTAYAQIKLGQQKKAINGISTIAKNGDTTFIANGDINFIRIFNTDTAIIKSGSTDFYIMGNKQTMYRMIKSGNTSVYDKLLFIDESKGKLGDEIFVKEGSSLKNTFQFWGWSRKRGLVKYLNERSNQKIKPKTFNSSLQVIDEISKLN